MHPSFDLHHEKTCFLAYAKTKAKISCAATMQLISAFVFATWIVQSLYFLNPKFQASSHLLWLYSPILCRTWSGTPKIGFLAMRLICNTASTRCLSAYEPHRGKACFLHMPHRLISVFVFRFIV